MQRACAVSQRSKKKINTNFNKKEVLYDRYCNTAAALNIGSGYNQFSIKLPHRSYK